MGLFKDKSKALERSFKDQSLFQVIKLCHKQEGNWISPQKSGPEPVINYWKPITGQQRRLKKHITTMNLSLTGTWMSNIKLTQIVYALRSEPVRATVISVNMNTQALPMVNAACALRGHKSSANILISMHLKSWPNQNGKKQNATPIFLNHTLMLLWSQECCWEM